MHRKGEYRVVVGEESGVSVALVHVEVDDQYAVCPARRLKDADRYGDVVQYAEPFTAIRKRVVRSAGEVGRDAVRKRHEGCIDGALHGQPGSIDELSGPRKAHSTLCAV